MLIEIDKEPYLDLLDLFYCINFEFVSDELNFTIDSIPCYTVESDRVYEALFALKRYYNFSLLISSVEVEELSKNRFQIVYHIFCVRTFHKIQLKFFSNAEDCDFRSFFSKSKNQKIAKSFHLKGKFCSTTKENKTYWRYAKQLLVLKEQLELEESARDKKLINSKRTVLERYYRFHNISRKLESLSIDTLKKLLPLLEPEEESENDKKKVMCKQIKQVLEKYTRKYENIVNLLKEARIRGDKVEINKKRTLANYYVRTYGLKKLH